MNSMNFNNNEVINELTKLRSVHPSDAFLKRLNSALIPSLPKKTKPFWMYSIRIALTALVILFMSGGGIIFAAQKSQPGDLLYPIKQTTTKISTVLNPKSTMPSPPPLAETVELQTIQPSVSPNSSITTSPTATTQSPTSIVHVASPLPTTSPLVQGTATVNVTSTPAGAAIVIDDPIIPIEVTIPLLGNPQPTPSPVAQTLPSPSPNILPIELPVKIKIGL